MAKLANIGDGAFKFTKVDRLDAMVQMDMASINRLAKQLERTTEEFRRKGIRKAVTEGGKVIKTAIKEAAPVDTGTLKRKIGVRNRTYARSRLFYSIAGAKWVEGNKNPAIYMHVLETGGKKKATGTNPFAKQAFDRVAPQARQRVITILRRELARARGRAL